MNAASGFFIFLFGLGLTAGVWARPLPSAGARALALGNAYVSEDEDVNALFSNPAGLTGLTGMQTALNYGRLDTGGFNAITEAHAAFGMPANFQGRPIGAAGGFLARSIAPGIHVFDLYGGFGTDVPTQGLVPWPLRGGGAVRVRQQQGDEKDPSIGSSGFGLGVDGGLLLEFSKGAAVGAALRDVFLGGLNPLGPQLRLGGRYRYLQKMAFLGELEVRRNVTALHTGVEWMLYRDLLRLRLGNGFRSGTVDHVAIGAGFNFSPAQFDVAYLIPLKTFNDPSDQFRVSVVYRFNAPKFSELYYDRALDMADDVERRVGQLEEREAQLKNTLQDLEQARRLAEEELARVSARKTESQRDLEDRILRAEQRAAEADRRVREMEEKVRVAEEKIRRAERLSSPRPERIAAPASAEKPKPAVRIHVVRPGDSLRSLAEKYYNDPERWNTIYNANSNKVERGRLIPGTELVIPE